jgi:hypothetical protein
MAVLDPLAPDQRAVVGLVLQQGRSYGEIADLLGISRSAVRARAHAGLAALAPPDAEVPADEAARLADFLLAQQDARGAAATRELIADSADARLWASTVAERLREVAPERVPDLDEAAAGERTQAASGGDAASATAGERPALRSSKLGGILLIAGTVVVVALVIGFVVLRGGDEPSQSDSSATAAPTATATATPQVVGQIPLTGSGKAKGAMTLFLLGRQLGFQIEGQNVPANSGSDRYAVWFTGPGGKADLIGLARDPVGSDGTLGVSGPPTDNASQFPQQMAAHRRVVVSRETNANATKPGPIVLSGRLPSSSG